MDDIKLTYYGHVFDASGYGQAARAYIHALHSAGVSLSVVDLMTHGRQVQDDLVDSLVDRRLVNPDFHLFHGIPPQWGRLAFRVRNAIGMTVWETDTMPTQWRNALGHTLDVWLPCRFNVETFERDLQRPVFRLPHAVLPRRVNGHVIDADRLIGSSPGDFVFYSIFEWQPRKGPNEMLRAYFTAFPRDDGVLLAFKVRSSAAAAAGRAVENARRETGSTARVAILTDHWGDPEIEALHRRGNCYVSLHRGEGWGYPLFDAAARGNPVIATGFSGPVDYLDEGAHLVPFELSTVDQPYIYYSRQMRWAAPDVGAAARHMAEIRGNADAARADAAAIAERIHRAYSLEAVGVMARERLLALLERANRTRWAAIRLQARRGSLDPPRPVPADWYDDDYFEHGLTSNWTKGYSWEQLGGVFRDAAAYLIDLFPQAESFCDVGCAKGFLVRCLRERGKSAWGIDHSPWAIAHADPAAKPFLIEAGVDDFTADREVDVLVAFEVLSQLTEDQALDFLRRARTWTRTAIVAVIPSFDSAGEEAAYRPQDNHDRTHITMHTRAWWHERFTAAGWRQDGLLRLGAEQCQAHPTPRRMRWRVYAYAAR
jgi:glycosyltransferase involved in cell wall biosynthesis